MMSNVAPMLRWGLAARLIALEPPLLDGHARVPASCSMRIEQVQFSFGWINGYCLDPVALRSGVFRTVRTGMQAEPSWVAASVPRTMPRWEPKCAGR